MLKGEAAYLPGGHTCKQQFTNQFIRGHIQCSVHSPGLECVQQHHGHWIRAACQQQSMPTHFLTQPQHNPLHAATTQGLTASTDPPCIPRRPSWCCMSHWGTHCTDCSVLGTSASPLAGLQSRPPTAPPRPLPVRRRRCQHARCLLRLPLVAGPSRALPWPLWRCCTAAWCRSLKIGPRQQSG